MSDNREILRTTFLKGMVPAKIRGQDAVDTYQATIIEIQKLCGTEVASLFAEPVRPTKPDPANPQMTWYTPLDGQMLDLAIIDEVARAPVISTLRRRLDQLRPALDSPGIGSIVASWLNITSPRDLLSVGGNPVLINWGYLPESIANSGIQRETHFAQTIQRYAPELPRPPFTVEETAAYDNRLRNQTIAPVATPEAPVQAAAPPLAAEATPEVRNVRPTWMAPLVASAVAAVLLVILLIPGVLVRPNGEAAIRELQQATTLLEADNPGLEERANALEAQTKERVCRLPDGQLSPLAPLPGQAPPTNVSPHADLLPPSVDRVQVPRAEAGAQPTSLNALLDENVVLIVSTTTDGFSTGSGFFVSNDRIVTNRHVVLGGRQDAIQVISRALSQPLQARVVALSASPEQPVDSDVQDFALLSVNAPPRNFLSLGPSPAKSTHVVADGYPGFLIGDDLRAYLNDTSRKPPDSVVQEGSIVQRRDGDPVKYLTHSAPLGHGNSGGPLVDLCGRVVGVNTLVRNEGDISTSANLAQDVTELRTFLERNGVAPKLDLEQKQCPVAVSPPAPTAQASGGPNPPAASPQTSPAPAPSPSGRK